MGSVRAVLYRPHTPGDDSTDPVSQRRLSGTFSAGLASARTILFHAQQTINCLGCVSANSGDAAH